jgi:hypothetical protein
MAASVVQVDAAMLPPLPRLLLGRPRLWGHHQALARNVPLMVHSEQYRELLAGLAVSMWFF